MVTTVYDNAIWNINVEFNNLMNNAYEKKSNLWYKHIYCRASFKKTKEI